MPYLAATVKASPLIRRIVIRMYADAEEIEQIVYFRTTGSTD